MNTIDSHDIDAAVRRVIDLNGAAPNSAAEGQLERRLLGELESRDHAVQRRPHRPRRLRVRLVALASAVIALTGLATMALSPWSGSDRMTREGVPTERALPTLGPARATAATPVLQSAAANMRDAGAGEWRYVRVSGWFRRIHRTECQGNNCTHFDEKDNVVSPPPATRNLVLERWSNGKTELGRQQMVEGSPDKCAQPSPLVRCVGEPYHLWMIKHAPARFPSDAREAERQLRDLASTYNQAIADPAAARSIIGLHVTAVDVAVILLTQPVYDAENRARIVRGLSYWQGAKVSGTVTDKLGRKGTQVVLPSLNKSYTSEKPGGPPTYSPRNKSVVLVLDVEGGRLLQYAELDSVDPPAMQDGLMIVEEQSLQRKPTTGGAPIDIRSFSRVSSTAVA